jgi:GDP-L-fucose synthase
VAAVEIPRDARVYVAGHRQLVGLALTRRLRQAGFTNILSATRHQLDLRDLAAVNSWFKANRPEYVFLVAGTVDGILANSTRPAEFMHDNLMIHARVIEASRVNRVRRLLYLGSSCIYPRECAQPIREEYLLNGTGTPRREFLHVDDLADACLFLIEWHDGDEHINVGTGEDGLRSTYPWFCAQATSTELTTRTAI